jgi:hypothetical protein
MFKKPGRCSRAFSLRGVIVTRSANRVVTIVSFRRSESLGQTGSARRDSRSARNGSGLGSEACSDRAVSRSVVFLAGRLWSRPLIQWWRADALEALKDQSVAAGRTTRTVSV